MLGVVPVRTNQLVGIGVCLFQHQIVDDEPREVFGPAPGFGLANQGLDLPPDLCKTCAGPHGVRLNQRVIWSWLSAPSSSRDKPVAIVGLVELSK